jgi:hypothetical protein
MVMAAVSEAAVPLTSLLAVVVTAGVLAAAVCDVAGVDDVCIGAMAMASKAVEIKPGIGMPLSVEKRANEFWPSYHGLSKESPEEMRLVPCYALAFYDQISFPRGDCRPFLQECQSPTLKILMLA